MSNGVCNRISVFLCPLWVRQNAGRKIDRREANEKVSQITKAKPDVNVNHVMNHVMSAVT